MERPIVRYLDPISGIYEYATVVDIGDLSKLNTRVKTNLVEAINSLQLDGGGGTGGGLSEADLARLNDVSNAIDAIKNGTFEIINFKSIDDYLLSEMQEIVTGINQKNKEDMEAIFIEMDNYVSEAINEYNTNVASQNLLMEQSKQSLDNAKKSLEDKAKELELANIGFSSLEQEFNELDNYISTNIKTIDFDNFNAMTEDYKSLVTQTSEEIGVDLEGSTLSYLNGKVTNAENQLKIQADEISSRMTYEEFQYIPMRSFDSNENLLFYTMDFSNKWEMINGSTVNKDAFLFGKIIEFLSSSNRATSIPDDLTVGESYVISSYVNVQPRQKNPTDEKYASISGSYDTTSFTIQIGSETFNPIVYEDLRGINGWVRVYQQFVAKEKNPLISFSPSGIYNNTEVAYMSMPKLEKGLTVMPWQPHVDDEYATVLSTQSMIKRQADSITSFFEKVAELDDSYTQATSTFEQLAEGFRTNTEKIEAYEDEVTTYRTQYENIDNSFKQKVWREDFSTLIEDVNIDNRNRVLNSDFIRNHIDDNRMLQVDNWSLNQDWYIKKIEDYQYLSRDRTGVTSESYTVATSDYFPIRNGEKVLFGFELIHSGLDNDKVFSLEFFDISNRRLLKQEFNLSALKKADNRYTGSYTLSTNGAEKARVVLQLPKNGSVSFSKVTVQNADIGSTDWQPAPEDSWIIQSRMQTSFEQLEDEIKFGAIGQRIDALSDIIIEDESGVRISPDKVASTVTNTKVFNDLGLVNQTNFEQSADGWLQEITQDGRLAGQINALPSEYTISFDKIHLDGTTWANALGSSKIYVTDQFALIAQDGKTPIINANSDGTIEMNVSKLRVGVYDVATKDDLKNIEAMPGPQGPQGPPGPKGGSGIDLSQGKMLYEDPTFLEGINGMRVYARNPETTSNFTMERVEKPEDAPTNSTHIVRLSATDIQAPGFGGFYQPITSRPNAIFIHRIIAKIPVGRKIQKNNNSMGTDSSHEWLTSQDGTGKYEEYLLKIKCGADGTFATGGHIYINSGETPTEANPLVWEVAYATVFDITDMPAVGPKQIRDINENIVNASKNSSDAISNLEKTLREDLASKEDYIAKDAYQQFLDEYGTFVENSTANMNSVQEGLDSAMSRTANLEHTLGDGAADWIFDNTMIRMSEEGVTIGNESAGTYTQVSPDRISFFSGSTDEVAYISNGMLYINQAVFVKSINISNFMISSERERHLTFRYVG